MIVWVVSYETQNGRHVEVFSTPEKAAKAEEELRQVFNEEQAESEKSLIYRSIWSIESEELAVDRHVMKEGEVVIL